MRAVGLLVAAALLLAAAGCGSDDGQSGRTAVDLRPCSPQTTRLCGTYEVPEDRARPEGRRLRLHVEVLPALRPKRRDPTRALFLIAGGPGGAASELQSLASSFYDYWQEHDIVLVDQRGTGKSNPVTCPAAAGLGVGVPAARITAAWRTCLRAADADPRFYTTAVAMDDLDEVRGALGYQRVDLWGGSYGATAVQVYLQRHGERVRSAILDGATLLDVPIFELWAASAQRALDRLFARCARQATCRRAYPDPAGDLARLFRLLRERPVVVGGARATPDTLASSLQQLTVKPEHAAFVPRFLSLAAAGRVADALASVQASAVSLPDTGDLLMPWAVVCSEPWARHRPAAVARLARGSYLRSAELADARRDAAICAAFPPGVVTPAESRRPRSAVPALFLAGAEDPQDPPANVAGIERTMPNARVVVVGGGGHGSSTVGCVPRLMTRFLLRGSAEGLDVRCATRSKPPPFVAG
jgi:pimeloyl-ACP methyl ester carboxylesterase